MKNENTLLIGDTHLPFVHPDYLDFCVDVKKRYGCTKVCHVGDVVDNHAISFHDHDPNGMSPAEELRQCRRKLKDWYKAFPDVDAAIGNHDELHRRKAYANGLPVEYLASFAQAYEAPAGWRFEFEFRYGSGAHRWRMIHGTGSSGQNAAFKAAESARISTAIGHVHSHFGTRYHASTVDIIWGMLVGCGIDRKAYAYSYGRDLKDKPILGCGVVLEGGRIPVSVPMPM